MGDGNIGRYKRCQYLRIYCNPKHIQYIKEVEKILTNFFKKKPYIYFRKDAGVTYLEISKKNIDSILQIPVGDKIKNKVSVPKWIWKKNSHIKSCIRGLFDTDGCLYITGGKYKIVNFCSHNPLLLRDFKRGLERLGYNPFIRRSNVELGRMAEVEQFFKEIKPRNLQHYRFNKPR